jgi:hypothetical protein
MNGGFIMQKLSEVDSSLVKLRDDFNKQLSAIEDDTHSFHSAMIELSARNPNNIELVQFIVLVNDKLETKHKTHNEVIVEAFNESINVKRSLIRALQEVKDKESEGFLKKIFNSTKIFADIKMTVIGLAAISIAIVVMISPDIVLSVIKALAALILG